MNTYFPTLVSLHNAPTTPTSTGDPSLSLSLLKLQIMMNRRYSAGRAGSRWFIVTSITSTDSFVDSL
jgi:hypothetical protein